MAKETGGLGQSGCKETDTGRTTCRRRRNPRRRRRRRRARGEHPAASTLACAYAACCAVLCLVSIYAHALLGFLEHSKTVTRTTLRGEGDQAGKSLRYVNSRVLNEITVPDDACASSRSHHRRITGSGCMWGVHVRRPRDFYGNRTYGPPVACMLANFTLINS
jgi:hypothetical protein